MTHEETFLQNILDNPDDDAPRLAFADWLERRGDRRGAFLRVQCALARLPDKAPERRSLSASQTGLLRKYEKVWLQGKPDGVVVFYERGLLKLQVCADDLLAAPVLEWWRPRRLWVTRLVVVNPWRSGNRRPQSPDKALRGLVHEGLLDDLPHLDVSLIGLGERGLAGLSLGALTRLRSLDLSGNAVPAPGLAHLSALTELRALNLSGLPVTDRALRRLSALTRLRDLDLSVSKVKGPGLAHLAGLTDLERLDLGQSPVGDAGLAHLARLTGLRKLWLMDTRVTDKGLAHLAGLTRLEELVLQTTKVTDTGLAHLAGLTRLRKLYLSETGVTDAGLAHLTRMTELQMLGASKTGVTKKGASGLRKALAGKPTVHYR